MLVGVGLAADDLHGHVLDAEVFKAAALDELRHQFVQLRVRKIHDLFGIGAIYVAVGLIQEVVTPAAGREDLADQFGLYEGVEGFINRAQGNARVGDLQLLENLFGARMRAMTGHQCFQNQDTLLCSLQSALYYPAPKFLPVLQS